MYSVLAINLSRGISTDDFLRQADFKSRATEQDTITDPARDGCGFGWATPVVPFDAVHLTCAPAVTKQISDKKVFGCFVEAIIESARTVILLVGVFHDRQGPADAAFAWYDQAREG